MMKKILFILAVMFSGTAMAQSASDYYNKANELQELGYNKDALTYYDKALEMEKAAPTPGKKNMVSAIYMSKGECLYSQKQYDKAIETLDQALKADPKEFSRAYHSRALAKVAKGDISGAIADFSSRVKYEPQAQESFFERATLYSKQGKMTEACADFQKSAQLGNTLARQEAAKICK